MATLRGVTESAIRESVGGDLERSARLRVRAVRTKNAALKAVVLTATVSYVINETKTN